MFVLSLSKDLISFCCKKGMGFDKLSPNGWETAEKFICDSPAINGRGPSQPPWLKQNLDIR